MNTSPICLSAELQAWINPPPITLIKKEPDNVNEYDIIKIKILWNLSDANSETYELKIVTFEHDQPEEFLALMKNFNRAVDGTGKTKEE